MILDTDGQAVAFFHSKFLRIEHDGTNHKKRCLTDTQLLELFDGEVVVEEKIDGKPQASKMTSYHGDPKVFWIAEEVYSKTTVHNHVIKYKNAPHHVWLGIVMQTDADTRIEPMIMGSAIQYGTISLKEPTIEKIHLLLRAYANLPSHYGAGKIEGLALKNYKKQLFGKWINAEFEDKIMAGD